MAVFSRKNSGGGPARPGQPPPPRPPEKYASLLVRSPGYANFYFNKLHQERLATAIEPWGSFAADRVWILSGTTDADEEFEIVLAPQGQGLTIGKNRSYYQPTADWQADNEPPGSGGMLTAMDHLRRLLTTYEKDFTAFSYFGGEPLDGHGEPVDVLRTEVGVVESRWYFTREPQLAGFDTQLSEDRDSCEIRFLEFSEFRGVRLPSRFEVRSGEQPFGTFLVERVEFRAPGGKAE